MANYGWSSGYPIIDSVTLNAINFSAQFDSFLGPPFVMAQIYTVIVSHGSPIPSQSQILNGLDASNNPVPYINFSASSGSPWSGQYSHLNPSTSYDLYFTLDVEDIRTYIMGTTESLPEWVSDPYFLTTTGTVCLLNSGNSDTYNGYVYLVAISRGDDPPTPLQIINGQNGHGNPAFSSASSNINSQVELFSLSPNTNYDIYFALTNINYPPTTYYSSIIKKVQITTSDTVQLIFKSGEPSVSGIIGNSCQFNFRVLNSYTNNFLLSSVINYEVLDATNPNVPPSSRQIGRGQDSSDNYTAIFYDSKFLYEDSYGIINGLLVDHSYSLYYFIYTNDVVDSSVQLINFSTASSPVTPLWTSSFPYIETNFDYIHFSCSNTVTTAYCSIINEGDPAPDASQIINGTDGSNNPAVFASFISQMPANTDRVKPASLSPRNSYDGYFVLYNGEAYSSIQKITFTSSGMGIPSFLPGYPQAANIGRYSADFLFKGNTGKLSLIVANYGSSIPTISQAQSGYDGDGTYSVFHWFDSMYINFSEEISSADMTPSISPDVLQSDTRYTATFFISNELGDSSAYTLDFQTLPEPGPSIPVIVNNPSPQSVHFAQPASFGVYATIPSGSIYYQWYRDNHTIDDATDSTYNISSSYYALEGNYWVNVYSSGGAVDSSMASLVILDEVLPSNWSIQNSGGYNISDVINNIAPETKGKYRERIGWVLDPDTNLPIGNKLYLDF